MDEQKSGCLYIKNVSTTEERLKEIDPNWHSKALNELNKRHYGINGNEIKRINKIESVVNTTIFDLFNDININIEYKPYIIPNNITISSKNLFIRYLKNNWSGVKVKPNTKTISWKWYWINARNWVDQRKAEIFDNTFWLPILYDIKKYCNFNNEKLNKLLWINCLLNIFTSFITFKHAKSQPLMPLTILNNSKNLKNYLKEQNNSLDFKLINKNIINKKKLSLKVFKYCCECLQQQYHILLYKYKNNDTLIGYVPLQYNELITHTKLKDFIGDIDCVDHKTLIKQENNILFTNNNNPFHNHFNTNIIGYKGISSMNVKSVSNFRHEMYYRDTNDKYEKLLREIKSKNDEIFRLQKIQMQLLQQNQILSNENVLLKYELGHKQFTNIQTQLGINLLVSNITNKNTNNNDNNINNNNSNNDGENTTLNIPSNIGNNNNLTNNCFNIDNKNIDIKIDLPPIIHGTSPPTSLSTE